MAIAQNIKLKFQKLYEHHPFQREGSYVKHPLERHFL
jgi:hypothetical protein